MEKENHIVVVEGLVKKFEDFKAVNNISFYIKKGEIFGMLGPNGAGKSTTINLLLSLLKPTSGSITINGFDNLKYQNKVKKMIGLMTQETVVEGDLTARENLTLFAELYHIDKDKIPIRVNEALEEAELVSFADKKARFFSGGMQRRLELVKSMIQDPIILILDEPTTGLDIQNRSKMWAHIRKLKSEGVTILLTTQYLEEADQLCDRIAIIDHGSIKAIGTPAELKSTVTSGKILDITVDVKDVEEVKKILKSKFSIDSQISEGRVIAAINNEKAEKIASISDAITKQHINVLSIGIHLPTMDEVFLKITGSGMRDTTDKNAMSTMTKMRLNR
jgi:ABC-2 type transport system ATP-binding protein